MRFLLILLLSSLACLGQTWVNGKAYSSGSVVLNGLAPAIPPTPSILQHVSFSQTTNSLFVGGYVIPSAKRRLPFANLTQSGNTLVLFTSAGASSSATVTVGDDQGQTWDQITYGANSTAKRYIWAFIRTNTAANVHYVYITNGSVPMTNMVATLTELNNVVAYSPVDATNTASGSATGTLTAGSITPTVTGDMVLQMAVRAGPTASDGATIPASTWTPGSQANITWTFQSADVWDGHAVQSGIYNSTASFTPQLTTTANPNQFICACLALKASTTTQGSARPAGMYIAHLLHQSWPANAQTGPVAGTNYFYFPSVGNLLIQASQSGLAAYPTNSTDTQGNQWTLADGHPVMYPVNQQNTCCMFATNVTPSLGMVVTNKLYQFGAAGADQTIFFYDVVGASTYPFDYGIQQIGPTFPDDLGTPNNQLDAPHWFTPSSANELVIAQAEWAGNTGTNASGPAGILFDSEMFGGSNIDGPQNADENNAWAHWILPAATTASVRWQFSTASHDIGLFTSYAVGFMPPGGTKVTPQYTVQYTNQSQASGQTNSFAFQSNVLAGSLIVVGAQYPSGRTYNCYDSQGHTYLLAALSTADLGGNVAAVFYTTNVSAGALTVKVAMSGANSYINAAAHEYAGFALYNPLDKTATNVFSSTTSISSGNTATTSFANELLFGFMEDGGGAGTWQPGTGFTTCCYKGGTLYSEDGFVQSTGAYAATATSGNSDYGAIILCTFH